jgi:crotonobetainyl-CoA:carnitine CoA-transferase CaiB-like acyl-CoA transferase
MSSMASILEGIKVLDLTRVIAGPLCTQILADMGATVFKIEKPGEGDDTRRMGPFLPDAAGRDSNDSALYLAYNRGKQSVTLDISTPEGARLAQDLAARCDVVVENYKAGSLAKYGLDEASIRQRRPDVIYCSVTGFGQSGPYASRPAYDFILQGLAGPMSTCGHPDGAPGGGAMRTAIPITDVVTGLYAAIGVLGALHHRRDTGEGQFLDAAMLDASVALNGHLALGYLMTGKAPARVGNTNPIASPSEVFDCADGPMIVAAGNNGQFQALCRVLGHEEWASDERFRTNALRVANRLAMREVMAPVLAKRQRAELAAAFDEATVPGGPINDMAGVFADPQTRHRELALQLPHGSGAQVPSLRSPLRFSRTPVEHRSPPMLGEHSAQVLASELGISEARLRDLRAHGVI